MVDFMDLLKKADANPEEFKKIVKDEHQLAEFNLTSAELEVVKKNGPTSIKDNCRPYCSKENWLGSRRARLALIASA